MNTTPSVFEPQFVVVGERTLSRADEPAGIALVVLHRPGRPIRPETFEPLVRSGAEEVVVVLGPDPRYQLEQIVTTLERIRFVLTTHEVSIGERINIGVGETRSRYVFTLWSDMIPPPIGSALATLLQEDESFCHVPAIRNDRNEVVPSVHAPAFYRNLFRTVPMQPGVDGTLALYPFADVAIYARERFLSTGGYDTQIANPYWQRLDFGMRAYLWGERIRVLAGVRVETTRELTVDDTTPDPSYARFFLKNLALRFVRDQARLRWSQFLRFALRSGIGLSRAFSEFTRARAWIHENRYRFVQDARRVTELWDARS